MLLPNNYGFSRSVLSLTMVKEYFTIVVFFNRTKQLLTESIRARIG
jgi:hypothetical protein